MGWQFAHPSKDSLYGHTEPAFCHAEYPTIRTENRASSVGAKPPPKPKNGRKILRFAQNDTDNKGKNESAKSNPRNPIG